MVSTRKERFILGIKLIEMVAVTKGLSQLIGAIALVFIAITLRFPPTGMGFNSIKSQSRHPGALVNVYHAYPGAKAEGGMSQAETVPTLQKPNAEDMRSEIPEIKTIIANMRKKNAEAAAASATLNQVGSTVTAALPGNKIVKQEAAAVPAKQSSSMASAQQAVAATQTEPTAASNIVATNAKTYEVKMLNNSKDGPMVFEPGYIRIEPGDSIKFSPVNYGHNTQSIEEIIGSDEGQPKAAKTWKSKMNKPLTVRFDVPGVYLYACSYHYIVGHVGVIQVGSDISNLETVKQAGKKLKAKMFSHADRVDKYLAMVK